MRIAIIGAGFCGLSTLWQCLNRYPNAEITLFDSKGIGSGASGIAAGLLHPFAGAHAKLNHLGYEGMAATEELLQVASLAIGKSVILNRGIMRPAITDLQMHDFYYAAQKYPEKLEWHNNSLFIKDGLTIDCLLYLSGLWKACEQKGAKLEQKTINALYDLSEFDLRYFTTGGQTKNILGLNHLPLKLIKGQILELKWPNELKPLHYPLNSQCYLIMSKDQESCLAGSTFEKEPFSFEPQLEIAKQEIMPKAIQLIPKLSDAIVLRCLAGIRAATPNHLPLVQKIDHKTWILTGMGSKGLLYHALMAKQLVDSSSLLH